jgi:hypothetical protein
MRHRRNGSKLHTFCSRKGRNESVRSLSLVFLASLVGVLAIVVLLGPVSPRGGLSVRPAEAAARVRVTAGCDGNPEKVVVANNTRHRIKVRTVGSIYQPRSNEPSHVDRTLRRGRSIAFESGPAANRNVLTHEYVFNSDVGTREGARVATSVGRFADRCN